MTLSRRAFLEAMLGAHVAARLLEGCGAAAPPHAHVEGALLGQDASAGHLLRGDVGARVAHAAGEPPIRTGVCIVGGGPAGLSAAYELARTRGDFLLLELEPELGGTSRGGSAQLTAYPWGAHYLPVPHRRNAPLVRLLREMGVAEGEDARGKLVVSEPHLVRMPEERLFYKGYWYPGLYLEAGASAADLAERARFEQRVDDFVRYRDASGKAAFTLPLADASDAPELRALARLPATEWLAREGFRSERLLWLLDYACRDDYGLRLADASAWALLLYFAGRIEHAGEPPSAFISWPEGNAALVRQLASPLGLRARSRQLVLDVVEHADRVEIFAWDLARDRGARYVADHAIVATPSFVTARIVRSLRERGATPPSRYAAWLVANLHLAERPFARGAALAWDNVLYDGESVGYVCATHQRGSDHGPTVLTYYLPLCDADPRVARQKLYGGSWEGYRDLVLLDLGRAHPGLARLVTRLDVFRWGHAMVRPEPGHLLSAQRPRQVGERVHLAHSDLSGVSLFEEAFDSGFRAASRVRAAREGRP